MTINFCVDYLRITVHLPLRQCVEFYNEFFKDELGELSDLQHGAKGFKGVMGSLQGFQLKHTPVNQCSDYCTYEFPGQACGCISPEQFLDFYHFIDMKEYRKNVNRIDLAFDNVPFTPLIFYETIIEDVKRKEEGEKTIIRSLTERSSVQWVSDPYQIREDGGGIGCDTCYFGKRSSMRYLRVYNKHGPTRLELEIKKERANVVAHDILLSEVKYWPGKAIAHLLDFIDINKPWWKEFIGDQERAYKKLHYAKDIELDKSKAWLLNQVAPALSAVVVCTNGNFLIEMDREGRKRMNKRYKPLITAYKSLS